jgi:hypothetical protein
MYFPGARGTYNGNSNSSCTILVGGTITMNGTAGFDTTGCTNYGTTVPKVQWAALVE